MKFINELRIYLRLQWLDRIQTSAFLVGISFQAFFQAYTLFNIHQDKGEAFVDIFVKSSLYALVGMILLSSMSALNNEFRYDTIKNLMLSGTKLPRLIIFRALSMTIISLPVLLIPGINLAFYDFNKFLVLTIMICLTVFSFGIQTTYLFNLRRYPSANLPWLEYLFISIGCGVIPLAAIERASMVFPPYWIRLYASSQDQFALYFFSIALIFPPIICMAILTKRLDSQIEQIILDGRAEL